MGSRLYRAVVGIGLGVGLAGPAACFRTDDDESGEASAGRSDEVVVEPSRGPGPTGSAPAPPGAGPSRDAAAAMDGRAAVDASLAHDGARDVAAFDVALDAFCDVTWPTTKGQVIRPTCGPVADCEDAGTPPFCAQLMSPGICGAATDRPIPAYCIGAAWRCPAGAVPTTECLCWEGSTTCPDH